MVCLPVPPLRQSLASYFFGAPGVAGADGVALAGSDPLDDGCAAGGAGAEVVGGGAGDLVAGAVEAGTGAPSKIADVRREDRIARAREVNMNRIAATVVAFDRKVAAPRLPSAVWLPPPPKAPAKSAPFPVWRRTTRIRITQTVI